MTSQLLTLPAIPLRDMVLFPGGRLPFLVGRKASVRTLRSGVQAGDSLALLTQRDPAEEAPEQTGLYDIGILARVESIQARSEGYLAVEVTGLQRLRLRRFLASGETLQAEVEVLPDGIRPEDPADLETFLTAAEAYLRRSLDASRLLTLDQLRQVPLARAVDLLAGILPVEVAEKQAILEALEIHPRLQALLKLLDVDATRSEVDRDLDEKTRQRLDQDHKQYVLNEKMRVIQKELGKKDGKDEFTKLREQVLQAGMSEEGEKKALEELERLETMPPQSSEATVSRTYVDWLLALPWKKLADEHLDLDGAQAILDEDHAGLEKVKARILEHLAVMKRLRGGTAEGDSPKPLRGPILCLVGPPGVGKTSLAKSIARALNRPFVRMALGGVRDEAEIRGHRRTYIGSMPGRIISLMKKAAVRNPLMLLDELDKMGSDWRGDPSSALLEVLDPEQNPTFQDHYLDLGFDLSQVLFIATANVRHQIPEALDDRLEVIELPGYTPKEKLAIAQEHLVPKALERNGMADLAIRFEPAALERIIHGYTKEAGVRQLEREIVSVLRKLARHNLQPEALKEKLGDTFEAVVTADRIPSLLGPERFTDTPPDERTLPGVVNGLAWTPTGGDLLTIEAATLPGKGNLKLTGKLGEVMQESAQIALSYVRARGERFGLAPDFFEKVDLHIHVPEGGIPKDGPSAGITLATALVSVLTGIPVRSDVAMTGELTLRGRVLPIGGLKEKLLAAHRLGCRTVLIPAENARHLEDVPAEVLEQLTIHLVSHLDEVLPLVLERMPEAHLKRTDPLHAPLARRSDSSQGDSPAH